MANNAAPVGVDGRDKHGHDGIPTVNACDLRKSKGRVPIAVAMNDAINRAPVGNCGRGQFGAPLAI